MQYVLALFNSYMLDGATYSFIHKSFVFFMLLYLLIKALPVIKNKSFYHIEVKTNLCKIAIAR